MTAYGAGDTCRRIVPDPVLILDVCASDRRGWAFTGSSHDCDATHNRPDQLAKESKLVICTHSLNNEMLTPRFRGSAGERFTDLWRVPERSSRKLPRLSRRRRRRR